MIIMRAILHTIPEKQKEVLQTLLSMVEPPANGKGLLSYGTYTDIKNSNIFNLISEWESRDYLNEHLNSDAFSVLLDTNGEQLAFFPFNNPTMLPVLPLQGPDGEWLRISVELPGRTLQLRGWLAQVGRVPLYLLDSNDLRNSPGDRGITGELYGGGTEMRLRQEVVLGIGGWRLLEALNFSPAVCHLNEGHAAFVVLERARRFMQQYDRPFSISLQASRAGNIFTTQVHPSAVRVELYADPLSPDSPPVRITMDRGEKVSGPDIGYHYHAVVSNVRSVRDYTPRVIPYHADASVPLEVRLILWRE